MELMGGTTGYGIDPYCGVCCSTKAGGCAMNAPIRRDRDQERETKILAMRPAPKDFLVAYIDGVSETFTAISREWVDGDCGQDGRCKRCFVCAATENNKCLMIANRMIPEDEAWDFSPKDSGIHFDP